MSLLRSLASRCAGISLGRSLVAVAVLVGVVAPAALGAAGSGTYSPIPRVSELDPAERLDPTGSVEIVQAAVRAKAAGEERKQRRASAGERDARARSRSAYQGRGRANALDVARRTLGTVMSFPLWAPPRLAPGEEISGYTGDHLIRVSRAGQKVGAVIYTPFPTRVRNDSGDLKPTDLSLEESDAGYETANAPVDVHLPKELADGVKLGETGVTVRPPASETTSTGVEQTGKVFWSDVAEDTDFMVAPMPYGFETFHVLRSAAAPEQLPLMLDLPDGTSLRYAPLRPAAFGADPQAGNAGIEIVRDGQIVGSISPPVASDADGEPVDVGLRIGDDRVTLEVAHRSADVKYPLMVDPVFAGYVTDENLWRDGYPAFNGWQYSSAPSGYLAGFAGNSVWGNGVYVTAAANAPYCCGHYGQWVYYAPGTSYIYRADLSSMYHHASGSTYYAGIAHANAGWQKTWTTSAPMNNGYTTICVSDCGSGGALPGNSFAFGMWMFGATGSSGAISYAGRVYLTLSDNDTPSVTVPSSGAPEGWTQPVPMSARVVANDTGLGLAGEDIMIDDTQVGDYGGIVCGDRNGRCPNNTDHQHDYDVSDYVADKPDGVYQVTARTVDIVGHIGTSPSWPVKIDSTAPNAQLTGGLAGEDGKELTLDTYKLIINADDTNPDGAARGSAGIQNITVKLDGNTVTTSPARPSGLTCPGDGCTLRHEWTLQPFAGAGMSAGSHTVTIEVRDYADNVSTDTITVQVPRGVMKSPRGADISQSTFKLRAIASVAGYSHASFQFRKAPSDAWSTITSNLTNGGAPVTAPVTLDGQRSTPTLVWNAAAALGSDTPVQLRAIFGTAAAGAGAPAASNPSATVTASYRPNGIGADYARQDVAPGEVNLITGNFVMSDDDVSVDAPTADLTVSRTYASRLPAGQTGLSGGDRR